MIAHWRNRQHVRITDHGGFDDMNGRTGRVVRICHSNGCAWIKCDEPLPANRRCFPDGDDRADHTKVYKDECEEVC